LSFAVALPLAFVFLAETSRALSPQEIVYNIENNGKQTVLAGHVESFSISRGNAKFFLGPGDLTLFDFGSGRICAMTFKGKGRVLYTPPNQIEMNQLRKFTGKDMLYGPIEKATFFFTVEPDWLPDTSAFSRAVVAGFPWGELCGARNEEFDHLWINLTNKLIGDLISEEPGTYFNAAFDLEGVGNLVFEEDPFNDDYYALYELVWHAGTETYDVLGGYSADDGLVSRRGIIPVDVTHYDIDTRIEADGDMAVKCRIEFTPLRSGRRYVYFIWHYKSKIKSVLNSGGDSLLVVRRVDNSGLFTARADEPGFGVILKEPMELGKRYSIDITYDSKCLMQEYGNFYIVGKTLWYPRPPILDLATYDMTFDTPKLYQVVSCGDNVENKTENGRRLSGWATPDAVEFVSFNLGDFYFEEIDTPDLPPVKAFVSKAIPHDSVALLLLAYYGISSNSNMARKVGTDVSGSLTFFTSLLGPCPFDTIRATELYDLMGFDTTSYFILTKGGQSSPGLIHLSWGSFQYDRIEGLDTRLRAHEASHQWWGHVVTTESYRDAWIIEGLPEYCAYWYYEMTSKNKTACSRTLEYWRDWILTGQRASSKGSKAGPVIMGYRLNSTKSYDYGNLIYNKGSYIFHMIRYLLHDYDKNSDDAFADLLKDMVTKFRGKVITTEKFRTLLEEHLDGDMGWFFNQYVYGTDIPEYIFSSKSEDAGDGKFKVTCHIRQEKVPESFQMMVPLTILFKDDKYLHLKIWVDQPEMDVDLPLLPYKPEKIIFNTYDAVLCKVNYE
jgi:hypothetical protein